MITKEERKRMFENIPGVLPKKLFARVVKDYEREWLEYTLPAGTIVPVEIYI